MGLGRFSSSKLREGAAKRTAQRCESLLLLAPVWTVTGSLSSPCITRIEEKYIGKRCYGGELLGEAGSRLSPFKVREVWKMNPTICLKTQELAVVSRSCLKGWSYLGKPQHWARRDGICGCRLGLGLKSRRKLSHKAPLAARVTAQEQILCQATLSAFICPH